jgi:hypothetical protein
VRQHQHEVLKAPLHLPASIAVTTGALPLKCTGAAGKSARCRKASLAEELRRAEAGRREHPLRPAAHGRHEPATSRCGEAAGTTSTSGVAASSMIGVRSLSGS